MSAKKEKKMPDDSTCFAVREPPGIMVAYAAIEIIILIAIFMIV